MISLTNELDSDSFLSEMSINGETDRKNFDLDEEKLNKIASNNRELINVQSQLAKLRSELEKSEMLRQTLEYELTLLRAQHGKQTAFTHHLQNQFNQSNEQIKQLQSQLTNLTQKKDNEVQLKEQRIKELESEAELLHDRERRIEALNEQIQKMEKTFSDSENLSRKNLAQSILAKERENELKKENELLQVKLEYSEQSLEQEKSVSNEAKLNVQLLTTRLSEMDKLNEQLKTTISGHERKIDEIQRQCSNEKLLRSTLSKVQSELEIKSSETQKLIIEYEKQLKTIRDELANYRRKFRTNEDKYNQIVSKNIELLRLTKIMNESSTNNQLDVSFPTLKQLEELKNIFESLRTTKIDQTNEINRLKKTIERLNRTNLTQKQWENENEANREKLEMEIVEYREKIKLFEENLIRLRREKEQMTKDVENKNLLLNSVENKFKKLLGKTSKSIENDLNDLEKQFNSFQLKINSLEQKLIERDNGTLILTQKLEEQVLNLKHDLDQRHQIFLNQKDQLLQRHQHDIQNLTVQLQKMEIRAIEAEKRLSNENEMKFESKDRKDKLELILKHVLSILIPIRRRYFQLIDANRFVRNEFHKFNQIKKKFQRNLRGKSLFRVSVIAIIAFRRFATFKSNSNIKLKNFSNVFYDENILLTFDVNSLLNINCQDLFPSLIFQINKIYSPITKGSLIKLIGAAIPKSSKTKNIDDFIENLTYRLQESEKQIEEKHIECEQMKNSLLNVQSEIESRVDFYQFERICEELQKALDREKQAQDLLNEQNNQLKSLTDLFHKTQNEKDFFQEKIQQNEISSKEKIHQLTKSHQQMEENVKRAEKAIRLVVNDKELISNFCTRINSVLNISERRNLDNIDQLITQLDALVQLNQNTEQKKSPPEFVLCQTMASAFINLLNRLKIEFDKTKKDIESLKAHCQMLTDQYRQLSATDEHSNVDSSQTVIVQSHPIRVQVNHHPQSAFKPIKPDQD